MKITNVCMLKAVEVCIDTRNKAACYFLAQHYESTKNFQEAIRLYTLAQTYSNIIRLAKVRTYIFLLISFVQLSNVDEKLYCYLHRYV